MSGVYVQENLYCSLDNDISFSWCLVTSFDYTSIFYVQKRESTTEKWSADMSTSGVLVSTYPMFLHVQSQSKIQ